MRENAYDADLGSPLLTLMPGLMAGIAASGQASCALFSATTHETRGLMTTECHCQFAMMLLMLDDVLCHSHRTQAASPERVDHLSGLREGLIDRLGHLAVRLLPVELELTFDSKMWPTGEASLLFCVSFAG